MKVLSLNKKDIVDFAHERNSLMNKSASGWVLFLDRDENLSGKIEFDGKRESYYLYRKNYFLNQFIGTDKIIRLVKKGSGRWIRRVHEVFKPSHPAGVIKSVVITHNTADTLSDYIAKINRYSDLHALANKEEGKKATLSKVVFYPFFKFIVTLFKSKNVVFSIMQSLHSFLSWSKLYFFYS